MLQLATQNEVGTGSSSDRVQAPPPHSKKEKRSARARTIAAIHITWAKIRRDLKGDKDELREARLQFMSRVLKRDVKSSRDLSLSKLGKVLDAMRDLEQAPLLPGAALTGDRGSATDEENGRPSSVAGQVVHLATEAQTIAINKLFAHLRWSLEAIEGFVSKRFKTTSTRMLTVDAANKLTMILLTIAASRDIKDRTKVERVSRQMIRAEIPALKRRLGIDQRPTEDRGPETEDYESDG